MLAIDKSRVSSALVIHQHLVVRPMLTTAGRNLRSHFSVALMPREDTLAGAIDQTVDPT